MHRLMTVGLQIGLIASQVVSINEEVNIKDTTSSIIEAEDKIELVYKSDFDIDNYYKIKNDISSEIFIGQSGSVNTSNPGDYLITITATDQEGNISIKNILFTVLQKKEEAYDKDVQAYTSSNSSKVHNQSSNQSNVQTYTPTVSQSIQEPSFQDTTVSDQTDSSTTYYEQDSSSSSGGFYDSLGACQSSHSTGQCIPVVGDSSGYIWQP